MKKILISDEFVPDYSKSKEEINKDFGRHRKKFVKAFKELDEMTAAI